MIAVSKLNLTTGQEFYEACSDVYARDQHMLIVGICGNFEYYGDKSIREATHRFAYLAKSQPTRVQPAITSGQEVQAWAIRFHNDVVTSDYLRLYHRFGEERFVMFSSDDTFTRLQMLCEVAEQEYQERKDFFILGNLLSTMLSMMGYEVNQGQRREFNTQILNTTYQRFLELVDANFRNSLSVEFYAQELCMTSRNLNMVCQKVSQQSVSEIIEARRLQEAKHYLVNTDKRIQEIGLEIGYKEPAYFINVFKKRQGVTPLEYRSNIKGILFKNFMRTAS